MAKIDTLLDKLCTKPTPADFRFSDLRKIMTYFGYLESNKGATSGHFQKVVEMYSDCDDDTLLIKVIQTGAACHTGHRSCFFTRIK